MSKPIEITVTEAKQRLKEIVHDYLPSWQGGAAVLALEAINGLQQQLAAANRELERVQNRVVEIGIAAEALADAETDYRHAHDFKGDGSIEAGRAWDNMRRKSKALRDALASPSADAVQVSRMDVLSLSEAARCLGVAQARNDADAIKHWQAESERLESAICQKAASQRSEQE